ncbi:hypothetical protein [Burkholderia cenocepacia]|uniref:hypothetical protein n=1 Tax=Burkholderia cenocepacia TaxID=95486 RepID=UPI001BA2C2E3|nr:hypothetical protein [Burkholderia cenocepacia]MBR8405505.1 hypothetical protein [Burkholderia cenocepacia]
MAIVYSIPNQQEAEALAIRRVIRASNAESMARRRARDEAERLAALKVSNAHRLRVVMNLV